jgi:hypothetical protein
MAECIANLDMFQVAPGDSNPAADGPKVKELDYMRSYSTSPFGRRL